MKILVAEDDVISSHILKEHLTHWGYEIVMVQDGQAALDILSQPEAPRLVLLDWEMPKMDGLTLCRYIRQQYRAHYIYIVLLTARTHQHDIITGLEAGADDYLTKPFDPHELKVRLTAGHRILDQEAQLVSLFNQLKQEEIRRKKYISSLTHDLRTPLVAERQALELIAFNSQTLPTDTGNLLESLKQNNQDLLNMVNQLLADFQIESGQGPLNLQMVSLHQLVEDCFTAILPLAQTHQMTFLNQVPHDFPSVCLDPNAIRRVLGNLFGNAVSHGRLHETVTLSAQNHDVEIRIEVKDDGPGILAEFIPHLFERYYTSTGISGKTGSGLGLSICKTLVERHNGTICVESPPGEGTCFTIRLPKKNANLFAPQIAGVINHAPT